MCNELKHSLIQENIILTLQSPFPLNKRKIQQDFKFKLFESFLIYIDGCKVCTCCNITTSQVSLSISCIPTRTRNPPICPANYLFFLFLWTTLHFWKFLWGEPYDILVDWHYMFVYSSWKLCLSSCIVLSWVQFFVLGFTYEASFSFPGKHSIEWIVLLINLVLDIPTDHIFICRGLTTCMCV